jgi:hypothetical protein
MKMGKKMMRMTMPLKHTVLINLLNCFVCGLWATALANFFLSLVYFFFCKLR